MFDTLPDVKRIYTQGGSHIEPQLDDSLPMYDKLLWHAAVVHHDTGIPIRIGRFSEYGPYSIQVWNSSTTRDSISDAWTYLNGVSAAGRGFANFTKE